MADEKRLIDANALLLHKRKMSGADFGGEFWDEAVLASDIKNAPTIDAVEVVRYRECKHLNVLNRKELYAHCPKTNTVFLPFELDTREHFCSLGERKEGAENG